ncbi:MAG: YkgJ family cysteine cluster protein [Candidatus Bathyarchaeota archaeon]|nr:YkgJ family cysteine cluster protein [Candidatus Bathyarchaeota archaeon]
MDFIYPANLSYECNRCGLCCGDTPHKIRHILLLPKEAQMISQQTGLPKQVFSKEVPNKDPYFYEMQKSVEGKCFFLKNNQCNIYQIRPLICRFYPFELKFSPDQGMYVFSYTLECPTINRGKPVTRKDFSELYRLAQEYLP